METTADIQELNGAETLMGFLCWLTTREKIATFSRTHDASIAVELFKQFAAVNSIGEIREGWPHDLTHPLE